jgi:hypothetical protein
MRWASHSNWKWVNNVRRQIAYTAFAAMMFTIPYKMGNRVLHYDSRQLMRSDTTMGSANSYGGSTSHDAILLLTRKYDIQQALFVNDAQFRTKLLKCSVLVGKPDGNTSVSYLLNGVGDSGDWFQLGISSGYNDHSIKDKRFGVTFTVFNKHGDLMQLEEVTKDSLSANRRYELSLRFSNSSVVATVSEVGGSGIWYTNSVLPSNSKAFVGKSVTIPKMGLINTGVMTETLSSKKSAQIPLVTYTFAPNGVNSFIIAECIRNSVFQNLTPPYEDNRKEDLLYQNKELAIDEIRMSSVNQITLGMDPYATTVILHKNSTIPEHPMDGRELIVITYSRHLRTEK